MAIGDCGVIRTAYWWMVWAGVGAQWACGEASEQPGISVSVQRVPEPVAVQPEPGSSDAMVASDYDRSSPDVQCSTAELALLRQTERELTPQLAGVLDYLARVPVGESPGEFSSFSEEDSIAGPFRQSFGEPTPWSVSEVAAVYELIAERVESAGVQYYCLPGDFEFSNGWQCDADGVTGHTFRQLDFVDLCPRAFGSSSADADARDKLSMTIVHELSHQNRNSVRGIGTTDGLPRLSPDYAYSYERLLRNWYPSLQLGNSPYECTFCEHTAAATLAEALSTRP